MTTASLAARHVVVIGSLNMDLVMRVPRAPEAGETLTGRQFAMLPGGKGANQAVACARLGAPVALVGRVGADAFGTQLCDALTGDGVDLNLLTVDSQTSTGVAMILVDDAAQNRIALAPGANATLTLAHVDAAASLIGRAGLLVLQLEIPLLVVEAAVGLAVKAGCPVLLNPAPAQSLPDALWSQLDYLVPNESEATALTGIPVHDPRSAADAARVLRGRGVRQVLITLGAQGVVIAGPDGLRLLPALPVDAIDTTAAGDTFIGGLAAGLLEGMPLDYAARLGQGAAALCVTRPGALPAIPYRAEVTGLERFPPGAPL